MGHKVWKQVDAYIVDRLIGKDGALKAARKANAKAKLPAIDVSAAQGKLLELLVKTCGARRVLEIGTLGGYSTIWMARALPEDGRLVTLEYDPHHATVAAENIDRAGLAGKVEIRVGAAAETLQKLETEGAAPFDMVFVDADKPNIPLYLAWALKLGRSGTVIVVDNIVRNGAVIDSKSRDPDVLGARGAIELLRTETRLEATVLQTVGEKGYDGFILARIK